MLLISCLLFQSGLLAMYYMAIGHMNRSVALSFDVWKTQC